MKIKSLSPLLGVLIVTKSFALEQCPAPSAVWDNCEGAYTFDTGEKYVGEWKNDKRHGKGILTKFDGTSISGEWSDDQLISAGASAAGGQGGAEDLFKLLVPSIVFVKTDGGTGSGVVIAPSLVYTNEHVISGASYINVYAEGKKYKATVLAADADRDTCILRVNTSSLKPIKAVRLFAELKIGEKVYALGNPEGLKNTFSDGLISQKHEKEGMIQTSAPITFGSSGGGLFDSKRILIGITSRGLHGSGANLNFAVPVDAFQKLE